MREIKFTLRQPYSKVEYLPLRIRGYIDLIRPFTVLVAFFSGIMLAVGTLNYHNLPLAWRDIIYTAATFALVTGASNALNQATDYDEDRVSKSYRPIPQGIVTPHEAVTISAILYTVAVIRSFLLSPVFGMISGMIILITIAYSMNPVRLKKRLIVNNLSIALARGYLPVIAIWGIWGRLTDTLPHLFGIALTVYLFGAVTTKDFSDTKGDALHGINTLPVVFGHRAAASIILPFLFLPYGIFAVIGLWQLATLIPMSVLILFKLSAVSEIHEYTTAWVIAYLQLLFFYTGWGIIL